MQTKSDYEKKASQIRNLANMPQEQLIDHLAKTHSDLSDIAPGIATHIQATAMNGLNYLHNTMPKPNFEVVGQHEWEAPKSQQSQWLHRYDAVNNPIGILDHVKNGTLSNHHLEAVQTVHPDLLQEMKSKVMEHMDAKNMKKLPYSTKIALSKFMGQPMDESMLPSVVAADQAIYANQPSPMQPGSKRKSSEHGLDKLNQGKLAATETQELETDEGE